MTTKRTYTQSPHVAETPALDAALSECARLAAENAALRDALKPFVVFADSIRVKNSANEQELLLSDLKIVDGNRITYIPIELLASDFKRIAAILDEAQS